MKIIYLTDIHGSMSRVYTLLKETIADIYIISGDLLDMPFYSIEPTMEYLELQNKIKNIRSNYSMNALSLEDFALQLMDDPSADSSVKKICVKYSESSEKSYEAMKKKYSILENIFSTKEGSQIYTIPGNYDCDLEKTALKDRNLHMKSITLESLKISGYGGADVITPGFPEKYRIPYNGKSTTDKDSELYRFLTSESPDIIMAHHPAHGVLDLLPTVGNWGSTSLRTYCDTHEVILCLSGHIHEQWGIKKLDNTLYMNPSNFGEVPTYSGDISEGGFFYDFELSHNTIKTVLFRKIYENRIYDIAEYTIDNETITEKILDDKRYHALKQYQAVDSTVQKYTQIPELRIFKDIRNFFRIYQTEETEKKINMLQKTISELYPDTIAMDLVGSANVGMAQKSSDLDMVLYLKGIDPDEDEKSLVKKINDTLNEALEDMLDFEFIDCIDLDHIQRSILEKNFACEEAQRFAVYRSICRPVNYRIIAPVEDLLNQDIDYRIEIEENIKLYLQMFAGTSDNKKSFIKYQTRLKTKGIIIPEHFILRIQKMINDGNIDQ